MLARFRRLAYELGVRVIRRGDDDGLDRRIVQDRPIVRGDAGLRAKGRCGARRLIAVVRDKCQIRSRSEERQRAAVVHPQRTGADDADADTLAHAGRPASASIIMLDRASC